MLDEIDRIVAHVEKYRDTPAAARIDEIVQAIDPLASNPLIGRPAANGKRELVMGRQSRGFIAGFIAFYQFIEVTDTVFVLAVRSQREAGYEH
ncbi:type II toxin-antitoxin system RelE/ParE family toxin [Massilia sp. PWRC2]|uniref:type II toxin-antitoxin system RelE/ParE family toxin n=1 Tax=Massilia sp. PWRC2 TaxID=2804626 RepID=UPI003CE9927E